MEILFVSPSQINQSTSDPKSRVESNQRLEVPYGNTPSQDFRAKCVKLEDTSVPHIWSFTFISIDNELMFQFGGSVLVPLGLPITVAVVLPAGLIIPPIILLKIRPFDYGCGKPFSAHPCLRGSKSCCISGYRFEITEENRTEAVPYRGSEFEEAEEYQSKK
ncbi:unnamed protein product [Calicophoron daubneyi]|uniref:Uncharacterized protein n=1 Tax=Calicophoron daubneyi TaxID=300641 RepID=A0AAV2T2N7_CALDB